ncbi:MAG: hypothetical protein JWN82_592 [Candidatus Saccharibacteria bacterium]|nr:hypothetical protein [Candidatus Saccharibacteria bacterium]
MHTLINRVLSFLSSRKALYLILALFSFESLWIALSSRFPMAFDEQVHYGITKLHTTTWLPFFGHLPAYANEFGPVTRDPSFLFYYLQSFPLRLIALFTDSLTVQIIVLRILNIGLVVAGLVVFRRLLLRLGLNSLRSNIIIGFFCLIPVFPLMAGQVSYDNMAFLMTAVVLLLGVKFLQRFQKDGSIDASTLTALLLSGLFASMVKYPFLPIFAAVVLCAGWVVVRNFHKTTKAYVAWWKPLALKFKVLVVTSLIVGTGLFAGSYGLNLVRYHNPVPKCDKVLSIDECRIYAPWNRDYVASLTPHDEPGLRDTLNYFPHWVRQMMHETFFIVTSYYDNQGKAYYHGNEPLPILFVTGWVLFVIGSVAVVLNLRFLWANPAYRLLLITLVLYTLALLQMELSLFQKTGNAVAIHGRYLIPLMIPTIGLAVLDTGRLLKRLPTGSFTASQLRAFKTGGLVVVFLLALQGGGLVSYIMVMDNRWVWQQSQPVKDLNNGARNLLEPLIYKSE